MDLSKLSFKELQHELYLCDNSIKELIIRKLLKDKYIQHMKKKHKKKLRITKIKKKQYDEKKLINDILRDITPTDI